MSSPLPDNAGPPEGVPPRPGQFFDAANGPGHVGARPHSREPETMRPCSLFLGIRFQCCRTYARIYRNADQTAYVGHCPKCRKRIEIPIGGSGTSSRFFNAS